MAKISSEAKSSDMLKIILLTSIFLSIWQNSESRVCLQVPKCYCFTTNITEIYCKNVTDIGEIQILLKNFRNIYKLSISGNLTVIPKRAFDGTNINVLAVRSPLTNLPDDALYGIRDLRIVNFGETLLSKIPEALVISTLRIFQMNFGTLSAVGTQLQNMTSATHFLFNNNEINFIDGDAFLGTHNLQYLNLSFNQLTYLKPETFTELSLLRSLDLKYNQLYTIDGCFKSLNPQAINLYGNNLTDIRDAFQESIWAVRWLDLGGNPYLNLSGFTFERVFGSLYSLGLSGIELHPLDPHLLEGLRMLQNVYLNRNNISNISSQFFSYSRQLKTVELSDNNLDSVDGLFPEWEINSLTYARVDGNNLTSLNLSAAFEDVLELDVSRNNIQKLRALDLQYLSSVEVLNMSGNPLNELQSGCFDNMHKVRVLDLSHSQLKYLNQSVQHKSFLKELIVSHSSLLSVEESELIKLRWIKSVNFSHNNLESVYGAFRNLSSIRTVDISVNNLTTVTEDSLPPLTRRAIKEFRLRMAENPWSCDCRLLWIVDWLDKDCSLEDEPICQSPTRLQGRAIRSLNQSDLETWIEDCPNFCSCICVPEGNNIFTKVNCSGVGLQKTPEMFPASTREIYLQDNNIEYFGGFKLSLFKDLRILNLEGNNLTKLELVLPPTTSVFFLARNSLSRFPYDEWTSTSLNVVTLSQNPWTCDCEALNFKNWLASHNRSILDLHDVRCGTGISSLKNRIIVELNWNDLCLEGSSVNVTLLVVVGIILGLLCVSCFFRNSLAALFYSCGLKVLKKKERKNYLYDAFLLYAEEDENFALSVIATRLEHGSPKFDLCIPLRDVNSPRNEGKIRAAFPACNKIIAIVSNNFIEEYSCMHLLRASMSYSLESSSSSTIIITHGKLPPASQLDPMLSSLMKSCACMRWGEVLFWEKLIYSLPRKNTVDDSALEQDADDGPILTSTEDDEAPIPGQQPRPINN